MRPKGLFIIAFVLFAASACSKTTATTGTPPTTETVVPMPEVEAPSTTKPADLVKSEHELDTIDGLEVLYIGHSFGQPFARNLEAAAELAGVEPLLDDGLLVGRFPHGLWCTVLASLEDDVLLVALNTGELGCSLKVPGERLPEAVADVEDFETIDRVEYVF